MKPAVIPSKPGQRARRRCGRLLFWLVLAVVMAVACSKADEDWYSGEDEEEEEEEVRQVVVPRKSRAPDSLAGKQFVPPRPEGEYKSPGGNAEGTMIDR